VFILFYGHPGEGRDPWLKWAPAFAGVTNWWRGSRKSAALAVLIGAIGCATPAIADEEPKYGSSLTYMIPADAPPSFDGHRESTYATVHSVAPFYSVLIRVNPENPADTTDFVCDLCTEIPQPGDDGKTYAFKIRQDIKFHDGSQLSAADVAASYNKIIFPADGL
jgi:peptide/nickel transport system substrate-binding protein